MTSAKTRSGDVTLVTKKRRILIAPPTSQHHKAKVMKEY
jgi:hypothetical protein